MQTLKFKTNINCGGCVRGVTPSLNENAHIHHWQVDLDSDDRILTVEADDKITAQEVSAVVADAGFNAQPIN
ncbi:heavy-metal-associated domain-containing protein [Neolewinella litorea]|uniref:Copper chaperone n=1 Tax=Neolewinella litorea TaxID=2562452 RepID=A0A4S4NL34_9BACT|nr:heavy-metal-associated domain-containing protein [Neolewinella litorea]THH39665.1 copper chaperone [Neolewinella litorea]